MQFPYFSYIIYIRIQKLFRSNNYNCWRGVTIHCRRLYSLIFCLIPLIDISILYSFPVGFSSLYSLFHILHLHFAENASKPKETKSKCFLFPHLFPVQHEYFNYNRYNRLKSIPQLIARINAHLSSIKYQVSNINLFSVSHLCVFHCRESQQSGHHVRVHRIRDPQYAVYIHYLYLLPVTSIYFQLHVLLFAYFPRMRTCFKELKMYLDDLVFRLFRTAFLTPLCSLPLKTKMLIFSLYLLVNAKKYQYITS